jgi:hypothetical protein
LPAFRYNCRERGNDEAKEVMVHVPHFSDDRRQLSSTVESTHAFVILQ